MSTLVSRRTPTPPNMSAYPRYSAFTAPWCGHCKALKPVWEKVAGWVKPESNVVVALIDADAPQNKHIGNLYEINSYPTILHFPAGSKDKTPQKYEGYNWELNLLTYINEHSGTFRDIGGYLNDKVGNQCRSFCLEC